MENLDAENIKRGLACCKDSYDCFTCDIYKRGCAGWREGLAKDALAFINLQEQRIKELTVELGAMRGAANSYKMHNERLTEENEKWQAVALKQEDTMQMIAQEKQAIYDELVAVKMKIEKLTRNLEIANLTIECKERICDSYMLQYGTVADKEVFLKKERADTVRKMQERLTSFFANDDNLKYNEVDAEYVNDRIDQIAKEMLEGI